MDTTVDIPDGRLLQVFPLEDSQDNTSVDIIAIHGLGTTSPVTWEARAAKEVGGIEGSVVNWLKDPHMLPSIVPSARIHTFTWNSKYYENAPVTRIQDVAAILLSKLKSKRDEENTHDRPLIFIASCFGGLIITKAIEIANIRRSEYQQLIVAISGIVFLGSPLQGTKAGTAAQWRVMLAGILNQNPSSTLLQDLDGRTKVLRETSERFLRIIMTPPMQTMTMCFWESQKSQILNAVLPSWTLAPFKNTGMILVEEDSACLFGHPNQQLDARHVMMNKFRGPRDPNFELVSEKIREMVREAGRITVAQREAEHIHNEHFMVSRRVNTLFTGREEALENLQRSLCPSQSSIPQTGTSKIFVIHGMGGAGKSEVALKFAYDNRSKFWGVFWIDGRSASSIDGGFVDIAKKCNLGDRSSQGARWWLQDTSHTWLLILDNADDPELDYSQFLPAASKGNVVITSRVKECTNLQTVGKDHYESLDEETAIELLLKACGIDDIDPSQHSIRFNAARTVVELLGGHALAIIQAGASISQGICSLGDYQETFLRQRKRLLAIHPRQAKSEYGDVYATFEVSFTYINTRQDQIAKDAILLLNTYAFLHFTNFPEKTFERAWRNSREVSYDSKPDTEASIYDLSPWHVSRLPDFMRPDSSGGLVTISLYQARALLASLSIITFDEPVRTTRMHPVTHMWARDRLESQEESPRAWLGAISILCLSIGNLDKEEPWWVQLQPHIEMCTKSQQKGYPQVDTLHFHQSFFRLSFVLRVLRADKAALETLQIYFNEADQTWTQQSYSIDIRIHYGICLGNHGDFKGALKMAEQVVEAREKMLSPNHPDLLASQQDLAIAYTDVYEPTKAIELLERILKVQEESLGPEHLSRLRSQESLAIAYLNIYQEPKATTLLEQVVKIKKKTLNPEHPDLLASQHGLAGAYLGMHEVAKAKKLLEQVVEIREGLLHPEHPELLSSQHKLAQVHLMIGETSKAVQLIKQVVKIRKKTLSLQHPDRLSSQHELAQVYLDIGETSKAIQLVEQVVETREKTLSPQHPNRLASQHLLAKLYLSIGEKYKAMELIKQVVEIEEKTLSLHHLGRLTSILLLGQCYYESSRYDEALEHAKFVERHSSELVDRGLYQKSREFISYILALKDREEEG